MLDQRGKVLLSLQKPLTGARYAAIGVSLLALKFLMDWGISEAMGHAWSPLVYLRPSNGFGLLAIPEGERGYYWVMLTAAVPFICVGVMATLRRLRMLNISAALTVLFFVPLINLFLFLALSIAPEPTSSKEQDARRTIAAPPIPRGAAADPAEETLLAYGRKPEQVRRGSFFLASAAPVVPAILFMLLSTYVLQNYGWGLFVGTPFAVSFSAGVLCGRVSDRKTHIFLAGMLSLVLWMAGMILLQIEGAVCLLMAAPIVIIMGGLGALVGMAVHSAMGEWFDGKRTMLMLLFVPGSMALERLTQADAPVFAVTTCVDVAAPRERVWENVVRFPSLAAPREWIFNSGVAYPTSATIAGTGVGAKRECRFSTGTFVEPITVWDEPRLLRFDVTENPAPLRELNPFGRVDPPHLHGFFVSQQGQFHLIALADGRTRLEGTTWYQHHMWPATYWAMWSDYVIHTIHGRVLEHIRVLAEEQSRVHFVNRSQ